METKQFKNFQKDITKSYNKYRSSIGMSGLDIQNEEYSVTVGVRIDNSPEECIINADTDALQALVKFFNDFEKIGAKYELEFGGGEYVGDGYISYMFE